LSPRDYDAVLFDLDGVLTQTASVHAAAWKRLFDGFLQQRSASIGEAFIAFDIDFDYRRYLEANRVTIAWPHFSNRAELNFLGEREDGPGANGVRRGQPRRREPERYGRRASRRPARLVDKPGYIGQEFVVHRMKMVIWCSR
jgi:phosphoglycolate phosphatase-like HAD superfamily hydrolase